MRRLRRLWFALGVLVIAFLHLPTLMVVLYAFADVSNYVWPIPAYTLRWFAQLAHDAEVLHAIGNTLVVATVASLIGAFIGISAAVAFHRYRFRGRYMLQFAILLPLLLPGIVTGVALLSMISRLGVTLSLTTIVIGHATFLTALFFNNTIGQLRLVPRSLEEAALDLGATQFQVYSRVLLPVLKTGLIASLVLALTLSIDEIAVTFFLTGRELTFPMWILGRIRLGQDLPLVNAAGTLLLAVSILGIGLTWGRLYLNPLRAERKEMR